MKHTLLLIVWVSLLAALVVLPFTASPFFVFQIGLKTLWLGVIASSLVFLSAYVGMISLAQTTIAGACGYVIAYLTVLQDWPVWSAVAAGLLFCVGIAFVIGLVTVRTYGVYYFMLTLAIAILLYYYAFEAQGITGGFDGINGIERPTVFGYALTDTTTFYYFSLSIVLLCYGALRYVTRSPFGISLQGVRDSRERMIALGFPVPLLRVAAFVCSGLVAALGGMLAVWYNGSISPGSIDFARIVDVVVVAVIGGMYRLEGAWLGAFVVTMLQNYVSNFTARYNTVIGVIFVATVLLFPDGFAGGLSRICDSLTLRILCRRALVRRF